MMKLDDEILMFVNGGVQNPALNPFSEEEECPYSDGKNVPGGNEDIYRRH